MKLSIQASSPFFLKSRPTMMNSISDYAYFVEDGSANLLSVLLRYSGSHIKIDDFPSLLPFVFKPSAVLIIFCFANLKRVTKELLVALVISKQLENIDWASVMLPLYTAICLAVFFDPIGTTIIQTDVFDSCKWKCLLFAQLWPGSFCMTLPEHDCRIPDHVEGWTIHGLWPSGRKSCNNSWHLTHEDIDDLQVNLFLHWPSLTNTNAFKFWGNEWRKHGTCAACADSMSCPHKYFSLALQLWKQFTINEAFIAAGITPSCDNSYKLEHFYSALTDMGTHVDFQCCTIKERQVLMQIKIPLSKDLSVGCNHTEENFSNQYYHPCTNKAEIYFYPFTDHPHNPCP